MGKNKIQKLEKLSNSLGKIVLVGAVVAVILTGKGLNDVSEMVKDAKKRKGRERLIHDKDMLERGGKIRNRKRIKEKQKEIDDTY